MRRCAKQSMGLHLKHIDLLVVPIARHIHDDGHNGTLVNARSNIVLKAIGRWGLKCLARDTLMMVLTCPKLYSKAK